MIRGAWKCRRKDDAVLKICCSPEPSDKPCVDSERVQKWRMSLASLLFFTVLLSDHLWLCAGVKLRSRDRSQRRTWGNASDGTNQATLNKEDCGFFLSNLTKSAPVSQRCADAQSSHATLESACTTLYRQKSSSVGSMYSDPPTVSPHAFLEYFRNFSLSFCNAYTVADLLVGMASPDGLNCSLAHVIRDLFSGGPQDGDVCSACVQAYVRLDQHAQEKYDEFDSLALKYQSDDYSVRARAQDCQSVYKAWLCSEFFPAVQRECVRRIPCKQYCLDVQTSCPFILPDNQDLVYGGLPSFICTGLLEDYPANGGLECCDVRWNGCDSAAGAACALSRLPGSWSQQQRSSSSSSSSSSGATSGACRLCSSRLKLCVLVLFLLHTVVSITTVQHDNSVALDAVLVLEDGSAREE
ncbi:NALCN channel auxiliary factor 2 [Chanos chanos]|uniref:NALCN channel auxiliary factor 2 n=1 Tax=Chanos chanos TaxID=29144 RepID=A0A6J2W4V2_CHACN|nr:transmembrane protein FAM155B [Chanos chanos]